MDAQEFQVKFRRAMKDLMDSLIDEEEGDLSKPTELVAENVFYDAGTGGLGGVLSKQHGKDSIMSIITPIQKRAANLAELSKRDPRLVSKDAAYEALEALARARQECGETFEKAFVKLQQDPDVKYLFNSAIPRY